MTILTTKQHTWSRDGFTITTDPSAIVSARAAFNDALASEPLYWAVALTDEELLLMLENSVCFGIFSPTSASLPPSTQTPPQTETSQSPPDVLHEVAERVRRESESASGSRPTLNRKDTEVPALIGLARLVTDRVTMAYLTDVYVHPDWQGRGLGTWLLECVKEWIDQIPRLRRVLLITGEGRGEEYYAKMLGTGRMEDEGKGGRVFVSRPKH